VKPFSPHPRETVAQHGEVALIAAIRRWLGPAAPPSPAGMGDDCAVLAPLRGKPLVTVDPVIYGEHFDDRNSPQDAGTKLFRRNLSDIAAMGGRPVAAVVSIACDPSLRTAWLEGFYRALAAESRRLGVPVVGGDIARLRGGLIATLTLIGRCAGTRAVTRHGARSGDWIYVTGDLGGSLEGKHCRFTPRLAEGEWLARQRAVRAMMDVSDGLAKDLTSLQPPRSLALLEEAALPISPAARRTARRSGRSAAAHALTDGEDYELVFAVARDANLAAFEARWRRAFPRLRLSRIGHFAAPGTPLPVGYTSLQEHRGFEHLRRDSTRRQ